MKEKIEIEDDHVRLMRLTPQGEWAAELELPFQAFIKLLSVELPQPFDQHPLLPPGCRWYGHGRRSEVVIVEEPPASRRIRFAAHTRKRGDEAPEEFYELAFPYVIFVLLFMERDFEEMKIFYRTSPLASMRDGLSLCNLFNVQLSAGHRAHDRACLRPKPEVRGLSLNDQVQQLVSHFWNTEFNLDIEDSGFNFYAQSHPGLSTLAQWEKESGANPFFVLEFPWEPIGMTLMDVAGSLMSLMPGGRRSPYSSQNLGDLCYLLKDSLAERPEFDHREGVWRQ